MSLNVWSKSVTDTIDPEIKKITQMLVAEITKTNQVAKQNRKMLKEAYRHPRVTQADIKHIKKAELANLKLLEETERFLKNQKH